MEEPDTMSLELLKSGDIERNPGPSTRSLERPTQEQCGKCSARFTNNAKPLTCIGCNLKFCKTKFACTGTTRWKIDKIASQGTGWSCMRCTVSAKNNDRAQPEVLVDVPTITRKCEQCKDTLTDKANPLTCGKCKKDFHKTKIECTGMSRWRVEKIIKEGKEWRCKGCRNERVPIPEPDPPDPPQPNDDNNQVKPGKCQHSECGNQIRKGVDFLICTGCKSHFHKRERCSQMTRKQVENLNRSTWTCLTCQEKKR